MLIGNQKFYIDVGATTHFLQVRVHHLHYCYDVVLQILFQEVVSVDLREGEGDFNVLGRIKHRVKVFSDVETLLLGISQPSSTPDDSNVRR